MSEATVLMHQFKYQIPQRRILTTKKTLNNLEAVFYLLNTSDLTIGKTYIQYRIFQVIYRNIYLTSDVIWPSYRIIKIHDMPI